MTMHDELEALADRSAELQAQHPTAPRPRTLEEIIAACAAVATVPEGAWEAEQERMRAGEARDELEATVPRKLAWARFSSAGELTLTPEGGRVATPSGIAQSRAAVRCAHVVWMGPPGAGKSSLGVAALRAWVAGARRPAMFVAAHHLATARIQHAAGRGEAPLVIRAVAAPLLLIDDLGQGNATTTDAAADVIRDRVDQDKPLWITTGLTAQELTARYDGGAIRRIFERAMVVRVGERS